MSNTIWKAVHLRFKGALHLSRGRQDSYDRSMLRLHSDKLKAALLATLYNFGVPDAAEAILDGTLMSSCFPFTTLNGKKLYFLPNPLLPLRKLRIEGLEENRRIKALKKVEYLSIAAFDRLYRGSSVEEEVRLPFDAISKDGKFLHTLSLSDMQVYKSAVSQHVYVNRDFDDDNATFYIDRLYFNPGAGFYFIVRLDHKDALQALITALRLLADAGIGTDRNSGYGHFDFEAGSDMTDCPIDLSGGGGTEFNLSLYCPKQEELKALEKSSYKLIKRGGYIASPQNHAHMALRKKAIYMFQEGSVFARQEGRLGKKVNLKPDAERLSGEHALSPVEHPIWRDGRSIFLPLNTVEL